MTIACSPSAIRAKVPTIQVMFLELRQLDIQYPGSTSPAVRGVNLGLRSGDIGVLIGPSGCGKTTLLRAVAGLEPVSGGQILLSQRVVSEKGHTEPAEHRRIGMVFQDYALFPHMDVGRNVGFGLACPKPSAKNGWPRCWNWWG